MSFANCGIGKHPEIRHRGGNHLSHRFFGIWAGDYRCPGLLAAGSSLSEAFPLHLEVFVRPGNLYLSVRQVGSGFREHNAKGGSTIASLTFCSIFA